MSIADKIVCYRQETSFSIEANKERKLRVELLMVTTQFDFFWRKIKVILLKNNKEFIQYIIMSPWFQHNYMQKI